VHRKYTPIYIQGGSNTTGTYAACLHRNQSRSYLNHLVQQDATLQSLFMSGNYTTCFEWCPHPSSGAHTTVSTASGTCQTVTATCCYCGRIGTPYSSKSSTIAATVWQVTDAVDTVVCVPDDGWKHRPKHIEQFPDINKLCNAAFSWIYIGL